MRSQKNTVFRRVKINFQIERKMLLLYLTKKCIFLQKKRKKSSSRILGICCIWQLVYYYCDPNCPKRYNVIQVFICVVRKYVRRLRVECLQKKGKLNE